MYLAIEDACMIEVERRGGWKEDSIARVREVLAVEDISVSDDAIMCALARVDGDCSRIAGIEPEAVELSTRVWL